MTPCSLPSVFSPPAATGSLNKSDTEFTPYRLVTRLRGTKYTVRRLYPRICRFHPHFS